MSTTTVPDFLPVLLGSDMNVYGMARSFHQAYGIKSVAVGKGMLGATSHSRIVSVEAVEPNLEDDKVFFERYDAGTVVRLDALEKYDGLEEALMKMDGLISESEMQQLNARVENGEEDAAVAEDFLKEKGLLD